MSYSLGPLETQRQTGRTTRMFASAIASAKAGKPTVVFMHDVKMKEHWERIHGDVAGLTITHLDPRLPDMDWDKIRVVAGPYANHAQFFDHDVIYRQFRHVLLAWVQYDAVPEKETA